MISRIYGIIEKIAAVFAAFLAVVGFNLLYGVRGESTMFSNSVFSMSVFGAFLFLYHYIVSKSLDRRTLMYGLAGGFLAALLTSMGVSLNYLDTIWFKNTFWAIPCLTPFFGGCISLALFI